MNPETTPLLAASVMRPLQSTFFLLLDHNGDPLVDFKHGLMIGTTFQGSLCTLESHHLQYGDRKRFGIPDHVEIRAVIKYDHKKRSFFNEATGSVVHSADFVLLDQGLIIAGWINRI